MLEIVFQYWSPSKEIKSYRARCVRMYSKIYDLFYLYSSEGYISWTALDDGYKILRPDFLDEREKCDEKLRRVHSELIQRLNYLTYRRIYKN